jgi:Spherulation-specific family 4
MLVPPNAFAVKYEGQISSTGVVVPLYMSPGPAWESVVAAKQNNPGVPFVAIVNPADGAGTGRNQIYAIGIQELQSSGITVLGYVNTEWGNRSTASIESDMGNYSEWYHVSGIFFDQMASTPGFESYYQTLASYAETLGLTYTMGNPGTPPSSSYLGIMNSLVVYENTGLPNMTSLLTQYSGYSSSNFVVMANAVGEPSRQYLTQLSGQVSYAYFTNDSSYETLPVYFGSEVSMFGAPIVVAVTGVTHDQDKVSGMQVSIWNSSGVEETGILPLPFSATSGDSYSVCVAANFGQYVFSHWYNGDTNPCVSLTASRSINLRAYYITTVQAKAQSARNLLN